MTQEKPFNHFDVGDARFYEQKYPEKEDLVLVKITRVTDMGAYVSLLEYNNLEGMVLMSELSKRRVRSIKKIVRVGRLEVVLVLRVDKEKGYIDLSKRRVTPEDVIRCEEKFSKSKKVHQIMFHVAQKHNLSLIDLNERVTWRLNKMYNHALDAFQDEEFESKIAPTLDLEDNVRKTLVDIVKLRLAAQKMRMRVRIDLFCSAYEGVNAVRDSLTKGKEKAQSISDEEVEIKLIAPPQYMLIISCKNKADGERVLTAAVAEILKTIRSYEGGDGAQQGAFVVIGGDEDRVTGDIEDKSDEEDSDENSESSEDETMGRADQLKELGIPEEET